MYPETPSSVVVVGSLNQDIVLTVPALPVLGETLLAQSSLSAAGGKGANQAVAAARAGAVTKIVCAVGPDQAASELRTALERERVEVRAYNSKSPTGRAIVMVDANGDNSIIVDQGANGDLPADFVRRELENLRQQDVLVVQCELAQEAIETALMTGREQGSFVLLNLAPFRRLSDSVVQNADLIVANEAEAAALSGTSMPLTDAGAVATGVAAKYQCVCIITLGEHGCVVGYEDRVDVVPAVPVSEVLDTTGAGDAFVGALAAGLSHHGT